MSVLFSNNASTTLSAGVGNSATSITVADGSVFPSISGGDYFYLTLEVNSDPTLKEIVKCTARSGNTLTITRGQDGTSARTFSNGDKCELRLTAAGLNDVATQADTDTTYTAGSGLSLTGTEFANTAPDQTVALTGAGATSISGTYPNFTITSTDTNTDTDTTYTAGSGLSLTGTEFANTAPDQTVTLTGAGTTTVSGTYPNFTITGSGGTYTAGTGITLTGTEFSIGQDVATTASPTFAGLTTTANVSFGDNDKAVFGADSDLQIYHDGSNSFVRDAGTGNLRLQGTNLFLQNAGGTKNYLGAVNSGAVTLYHDNAAKLATTSTGIDVTGQVITDASQDAWAFKGTTGSSGNHSGLWFSGEQARLLLRDGTGTIKTMLAANGTDAQNVINGNTIWHAGNDGSGSGLDADTVDGVHASSFLRSDADDEKTGHLKLRNNAWLWTQYSPSHDEVRINANTNGGLDVYNQTDSAFAHIKSSGLYINNSDTRIYEGASNSIRNKTNSGYVDIGPQNGSWCHFNTDRPAFYFDSNTHINGQLYKYSSGTTNVPYWHAGNDGSGSGLDADTVDGQHESAFMRRTANSHLNMVNHNITNVNHLTFNDSGVNEGLEWLGGSNWRIFESPDNLTNASGNLQFTTGGTRRFGVTTAGYIGATRIYSAVDRSSGYFYNDSGTRTAYANSEFYIQNSVPNYYNYATNIYLGYTSGDTVRFRGNTLIHNGFTFDSDGDLSTTRDIVSTARNRGVFGTYSSTKTDQIWSMGTAYRNHSSGTNFGNLYGLAYKHTNNSTGGTMGGSHQMVWCQNGSPKCSLGTNIWTSGNVTAYSDIRVKTNIEHIPNALDKVCQLNGYTFDRTDVTFDEHGVAETPVRQTGVIAQEVLEVLPEAVIGDEEGHYSVAYGNMVGLLIESIKELKAEVDDLKAQLESK